MGLMEGLIELYVKRKNLDEDIDDIIELIRSYTDVKHIYEEGKWLLSLYYDPEDKQVYIIYNENEKWKVNKVYEKI